MIVLKSAGKQQLRSNQFRLITEQIENRAVSNQIPVTRIKFESVKKSLCRDRKPTKANAFKILADAYPELRQFTGTSSKWRAQYFDSLLVAAALGYYYQTESAESRRET